MSSSRSNRLCALARVSVLCCFAWMVGSPNHSEAKCKPGMALTPGDHVYNVDFGGMSRVFILHVPPGYDGKKAVPVVFDLHGFSSNGPQQLGLSGFEQVADKEGFLVVAPTGYMNSWNGDIAFGSAFSMMLDDVGLMKAIRDKVAEEANIDHGRVFSTGLSNGAAMSNTLGCKAADTFAGVAPVADPLDIGRDTCMPVNPMSVIGFHGYTDEYVPYEGGPGGGPRLPEPFPSIPDTLKAWAQIMKCTGMPEVETIEGMNKCEIYRECDGDAEVGYCSLEGGHVLYQQSHLDIAEYAWKFFSKHTLPLPDADGDKVPDDDDNCVSVANPDQADADGNCVGDACECKSAADCDDTMFCNGAETCTDGVCAAGAAACTPDQSCDEATKQCGASGAAPAGGAAGASGAESQQPSTAGSTAASSGAAGAATSPVGSRTQPQAAAAGSGAAAVPSGTSASAGSGAAAPSGDATTQPAAGAEPAGGCGCSLAGTSHVSRGPLSLLGLGLAWQLRRSTRRRRRKPH
jgi:MYXO-CTERM domain-containing protein